MYLQHQCLIFVACLDKKQPSGLMGFLLLLRVGVDVCGSNDEEKRGRGGLLPGKIQMTGYAS